MISCFAHGFVPEKPAVKLIGANKAKCEFTVVSPRSVKRSDGWETVWERATFVAWDDEAERVASRLDRGVIVTCTGNQETSVWTDSAGAKHYSTKYRLTSWTVEPHNRGNQDADRHGAGGTHRGAGKSEGAPQATSGRYRPQPQHQAQPRLREIASNAGAMDSGSPSGSVAQPEDGHCAFGADDFIEM